MNAIRPENSLSVVLPTYNEAGNIVELIRSIKAAVPVGMECEILVVDDNSPDGTFELARSMFEGDPGVRTILRTTDRGFAKSIRHGIEAASHDRIVVMDSDLTHDAIEIPRLIHVGQIMTLLADPVFAQVAACLTRSTTL